MTTYNRICPMCGYLNKDLYLEDSNGWMECEKCKKLTRDTDVAEERNVSRYLFHDRTKERQKEMVMAAVTC